MPFGPGYAPGAAVQRSQGLQGGVFPGDSPRAPGKGAENAGQRGLCALGGRIDSGRGSNSGFEQGVGRVPGGYGLFGAPIGKNVCRLAMHTLQ